MGCFCKTAMGPLQRALSSLNDAAPDSPAEAPAGEAAGGEAAGGERTRALASWLGARGLPAPPWAPDPDWQQAPLPRLGMGAQAMLTMSAIANLRAQALAQFGLDLQQPAQATMFARLAATLGARMSAMADAGAPAGGGQAWQQLGALNAAADQVRQAAQTGVFAADPQTYAVAPQWQPFLAGLRPLLPLISVGSQFGLDLSTDFSAALAAAVRPMLAVQLPALPAATLNAMAGLAAQLSAVDSLARSLGVDPLQAGYRTVRKMVADKVAAVQQAVPASSDLPATPYCPTVAVTPAVVQAALAMNPAAVAALTWRAPALTSVPLLQVGLPVASLAAQLSAALGIRSATSPCAGGCDANGVLRAAAAA